MAINPAGDAAAELANMVALLGTDGTYTIAKTNVATPVRGLMAKMNKRDVELINSYGLNGSTLTFQASVFAQRPAKFDTWVVNGQKYVFDSVVDIVIAGVLIGWTVYCLGTKS